LGGFSKEHKSKLVFMSKNQHKASNFVKLIYDSQLLQFVSKISSSILMEDDALMDWSKVHKERRKTYCKKLN